VEKIIIKSNGSVNIVKHLGRTVYRLWDSSFM